MSTQFNPNRPLSPRAGATPSANGAPSAAAGTPQPQGSSQTADTLSLNGAAKAQGNKSLMSSVASILLRDALNPGDTGPEVEYLQYKLSVLGCYKGATTGVLDAPTIEAVKTFQSNNHHWKTGVVTGALLAEVDQAIASRGLDLLGPGAGGAEVTALQYQLKALGNLAAVDGQSKFDEKTFAALKAFQKANALPDTGILDASSQEALNKQLAANGLLALGSEAPEVAQLTQRLMLLGLVPKAYPKFEPLVQQAVKQFQAQNGLEPSGIVSPSLFPTLNKALEAKGVLLEGSEGRDVALLQRKLLKLNIKVKLTDEVFTAETAASVSEFQKKNNLPPTGIADQSTRTLMDQQIAEAVGKFTPQPDNEFLKELLPAALEVEKRDGIPAAVILAQAALESEWGKRGIAKYNIFGIKALPGKPKVLVPTKEFVNNRWIKIEDYFAKFSNYGEALDSHAELFYNGNFSKALKNLNDPKQFAKSIQGIYATDPNYANLLISIMKEQHLLPPDPPKPVKTAKATRTIKKKAPSA